MGYVMPKGSSKAVIVNGKVTLRRPRIKLATAFKVPPATVKSPK
jgi:hypothetical protein